MRPVLNICRTALRERLCRPAVVTLFILLVLQTLSRAPVGIGIAGVIIKVSLVAGAPKFVILVRLCRLRSRACSIPTLVPTVLIPVPTLNSSRQTTLSLPVKVVLLADATSVNRSSLFLLGTN